MNLIRKYFKIHISQDVGTAKFLQYSTYVSAYNLHEANKKGAVNPRGPKKGQERVISGGSFKSDAKDVRSAARDFTKTKAWLVTDPQMPKSVWWYSDSNDIGFRVVCEVDESIK